MMGHDTVRVDNQPPEEYERPDQHAAKEPRPPIRRLIRDSPHSPISATLVFHSRPRSFRLNIGGVISNIYAKVQFDKKPGHSLPFPPVRANPHLNDLFNIAYIAPRNLTICSQTAKRVTETEFKKTNHIRRLTSHRRSARLGMKSASL
ncbi:MAG: hypothetical protein ACE5EM_10660 [Sphingomonadales bacterium]